MNSNFKMPVPANGRNHSAFWLKNQFTKIQRKKSAHVVRKPVF